MSGWTHIHLEAHCFYSFLSRKVWKGSDMETEEKTVRDNPEYISRSERSEWCKKENKKRLPQFKCMCERDNVCPFFGFTDCEKKEYIAFDDAWESIEMEDEDYED